MSTTSIPGAPETASSSTAQPTMSDGSHLAWLAAILGLSLSYAILRYNIFKGVEWAHFPLYIVNKAFSLSAVICIAMSYVIGKLIQVHREDREKRIGLVKFLGLIGFSLAAMHGLMSLTLFSPVYYEKFFLETGKLTFEGELSFLFGVLSLWCLTIPAITSLPFMDQHLGRARWRQMQQMGYAALALNAGHVFAMGFAGWLDTASWPGGLPPITMLGFVFSVLAILTKMIHSTAAKPA